MRRSLVACGVGCIVLLGGDERVETRARDARATADRGVQLGFERNDGQLDASVRYWGRFGGLTIAFRDDGPTLAIGSRAVALRVRGAARSTPIGSSPLVTKSNYFVGREPSRWHTRIPNYGVVTYRSVLPGVDLRFRATNGKLEYDLVLAPGASTRDIEVRLEGAERVSLARDGDVEVRVGGTSFVQRRPRLLQGAHEIEGGYRIVSDDTLAFDVGAIDVREPLLIDPVIEYSTYFGGKASDRGSNVAVDSAGNAYVVGYTGSSDLPTKSPYQAALAGTSGAYDAFVAKIDASGTTLLYSTYLGGSGDDRASDIAVDSQGNAYVVGGTSSNNFPVANALQSSYGGVSDAFVTKLDASGSSLVYSTYLGGSGNDSASKIVVDAADNAYVTGEAQTGFPTKNAFQSNFGGGGWDVFVAKLAASGSSLAYATFLGGSSQEIASGIAIDAAGSAYVTGSTFSTNFPTLNPFQAACSSTCGSLYDVFVTKLAPTGNALAYSTYVGGTGDDYATGIGVDAAGDAYVTGETSSKDFPTQNALQPSNAGGGNGDDDFVAKLNASGDALVFSTYLGGNQNEFGAALAVDPMGDVFLAGTTLSANFPTTQDATQSTQAGNYDAFLAVLPPTGAALSFSTFIGGSGGDFGGGVAIDNAGNAFVTGYTQSTSFPTKNASQSTFGGLDDAFVTKISGLPNVYDAGSSDAGMDASADAAPDAPTVDAAEDAADAGAPAPGTSGCSCRSADGDVPSWPALLVALATVRGLANRRARSKR